MTRPANSNKHMIYAEDVLWALMQHQNKAITKSEIKAIVEQVVAEKEVTIGMCMPIASCVDLDSEEDY